ncbi:MAG: sugar ABC transporter substrate-binding protein [Christensenella sp.]
MKKITVIVAVLLVAVFMFAACGAPAPAASSAAPTEAAKAEAPAEDAKPEAPAAEECVIGLNAGTETNQFHSDVNNSIKNVAKDKGVKVLYAVSEFDAQQIIPKVESLLQQGANVIVDFNVNSQVGGNLVDIVKEKGGKGVIGIDVEYINSAGEKAWFMGANNQQAGELCGQAIGDYAKANKDGKLDALVLFHNSENGDEVKKRMAGAIDGLKSKGIEVPEDKIEWIELGGGGSETTVAGRDKMTAWLTAHPDAHSVGVVAVNDETTTGALAGAETLGRQEDCIFASHNVSQVYMDAAASGNLYKGYTGSVAYSPEKYGEYIVPLAMDIASGKNTDSNTKITVDHTFITPDKVADYQKGYEDYKAKWTVK